MNIKDKFFSNFVLLVALALSSIAAWYSIIGLTAIFSGAVVPVIIMGSALEVAKIATTVWLRKYWKYAGWVLKLYLVPAVVALALLTSMGIFGFLSKAHLDQGVPTGDVAAKVALLDEKIKTERDNIETSKKALQQMDSQVDQMLGRTDSDKGAERAVQIRRQQQKERGALQNDIAKAQATIAKLNEERAPIASELRKVEAEVGPIKYIAALIYGDNPDQNILERAVRWVIILLVIVFDPLAIALVLAANASKEWDQKILDDRNAMLIIPPREEDIRPFTEEEVTALNETITATAVWPFPAATPPDYPADDGPLTNEQIEQIKETAPTTSDNNTKTTSTIVIEPITPEEEEYYKLQESKNNDWSYPITESRTIEEQMADTVEPEEVKPTVETITVEPESENAESSLETEGVTKEAYRRIQDTEYVEFEGKRMHERVLKDIRPDFFELKADDTTIDNVSFGTQFPEYAALGDVYVRVDTLPNRVFKFNGRKWIEINRENSDTYLGNTKYLQYLVDKISTGEFDPEMLTELEQDAVADHIRKQRG